NVLQGLLTHVFECEIELAGSVLLYTRRDGDPARFGQLLKPCGDVDAVAKNIAVLDDDVALMDPYTELDPTVAGPIGIECSHLPLHLDHTPQCINDARELN